MQNWAPPQYSEDGSWWWNGQQWVPVTWSVQSDLDWQAQDRWQERGQDGWQPPERQPRLRRTPAILWVGLVALVLLLVLAAGGGAVISRELGLGGSQGAAPANPPAQTPAPAPTDAAPSSIDDYKQAVLADAARFQDAGQAAADRCAPAALRSGTADCQAALQSLDASVQTFQTDLDAHPAPTCLQPADRELRTALSLYRQGAREELSGLQRGDPLAVVRGAGTLSDATAHARAAGSQLSTSC